SLALMLELFSFTDPAPPLIHTLSLHDALPISETGGPVDPPGRAERQARPRSRGRRGDPQYRPRRISGLRGPRPRRSGPDYAAPRSEEHTSELQSPYDLVCRLLLEKKKTQ